MITLFQSPSLRGSGRFRGCWPRSWSGRSGFNPLHCGAVVASGRGGRRRRGGITPVSIPFIAGQWSLQRSGGRSRLRCTCVSIPFIAGQWSLLNSIFTRGSPPRVSIPFIAGQWSLLAKPPGPWSRSRSSFNPLHRGAVVASTLCLMHLGRVGYRVSIPFIAGQWSLQGPATLPVVFIRFQSPSSRGSGRFHSIFMEC